MTSDRQRRSKLNYSNWEQFYHCSKIKNFRGFHSFLSCFENFVYCHEFETTLKIRKRE